MYLAVTLQRGEGEAGGELHCASCEESGLHKIVRETLVTDFYCVGSRAVLFTEHMPVLENWKVPTLEITHWEEGLSVWFLRLYKQCMCTSLFLQPRNSRLLWSFPSRAACGREAVSVWTHANTNIVKYFAIRSCTSKRLWTVLNPNWGSTLWYFIFGEERLSPVRVSPLFTPKNCAESACQAVVKSSLI